MDPHQYQQQQLQQQQQTASQTQHQTEGQQQYGASCPNCGAPVEPGQRFCEECGCPLSGSTCPHCHGTIEPGLALCPHCGKPVNTANCSFCGAAMDPDEQYCSSCGNPRQGIICPECGTRNFRSFCRQCNHPLNEMAQQSLIKASNNPHVIKARQLNAEVEELQQRIMELATRTGLFDNNGNSIPLEEKPVELSEEDKQLLNMFDQLINNVSGNAPVPAQQSKRETTSTTAQVQETEQESKDQLKSALQDYQAKLEELQRAIDAIIPDPGDPPEVQRNFLHASQVVTYSITKSKRKECMGWVCNWCGCHHLNPSECCRPELGGKWIYKEVESISKIKHTATIYL